MRHVKYIVLVFALLFNSYTLAQQAKSSISLTHSSAESSMGTREVLLDNERVMVVRLVYPAGAESGMHTHAYATRTAYFEKGGLLEIHAENHDIKQMHIADGQALYLPAATHNIKNVGTTEIVIIEQELK